MKRMLTFALSAAIALSLAACGADKQTNRDAVMGSDSATWGP